MDDAGQVSTVHKQLTPAQQAAVANQPPAQPS